MQHTILFKFATRSRFPIFRRTLDQYYALLSGKHKYQFYITLDTDDEQMNVPEVKHYLDSKPNLRYFYGNSKNKVEAINADLEKANNDWTILVCVSDDQVPRLKNYDEIIAAAMDRYYPHQEGCLHFNDGNLGGRKLWTQSILGRKYFNAHEHHIYDPRFESLWCDNWAQYLAEKRHKLTYIDKIIISHEWVKLTGKDALHLRNSSSEQYEKDKNTYEQLVKALEKPQHEPVVTQPIQYQPGNPNLVLSILTPTLPGRKPLLDRLRAILEPQLTLQVEWLLDDSPPPTSIGRKRQKLLERATGRYVCSLDDDDTIAPDYVEKILQAAKQNSDCIGFSGFRYSNGNPDRTFVHSIRYRIFANKPGLYERTPNHLNPIRRDIAIKVGFLDRNNNEDGCFADAVKQYLTTETFIEGGPIYYYWYDSRISTCNNLDNRLLQFDNVDKFEPVALKVPITRKRRINWANVIGGRQR